MEDVREFQNLQPGLATAPVLFASEECPQLLPLIQRHCPEPGDIKLVSSMKRFTNFCIGIDVLSSGYRMRSAHIGHPTFQASRRSLCCKSAGRIIPATRQ